MTGIADLIAELEAEAERVRRFVLVGAKANAELLCRAADTLAARDADAALGRAVREVVDELYRRAGVSRAATFEVTDD